jgi:23S rRNA (guanosine2251-2'-O)-methyltransferase
MLKKQRSPSRQHHGSSSKAKSSGSSRKGSQTRSNQQHRLKHNRKNRQTDRTGTDITLPRDAVLAWGWHAVRAALHNPARSIIKIYASPDRAEQIHKDLSTSQGKQLVPEIEIMEKTVLSDVVAGHLPVDEKAVHQGVVALMKPLISPDLEDWLDNHNQERIVVILLDQITDGRNIGAIMRSARAFRALALITAEKHCPPESGMLLRAASGAAEHIPLIKVVNLSRTIEKLQNRGFTVAGMTAAGETSLDSLAGQDRLGIVVGAEGKGLRRMTTEHVDYLVSIPIDAGAESLNVSNAAAIALYAASRND